MRSLLALVAVLSMTVATTVSAAETRPDDEGFIRDWLFLGPMDLGGEDMGADEIAKSQIAGEETIQPKEGDKQKLGKQELTWKAIKAAEYFVDLNKLTNKVNEDVLGYLVTYVVAEKEMPGLTVAIGSNDQCKVYVNGKKVIQFTDTRTIEKDSDKAEDVTLKKGVNVIVFKIINQKNDWQAALRFKGKDGKAVKELKVQTSP